MKCRLILASGSPRRSALLAELGLSFEVRPAGVDESLTDHGPAQHQVERLARLKAEACEAAPADAVLAADTLVVLDGRALGKPIDDDDARATLRLLRSREHDVVTGVALRWGSERLQTSVRTSVEMRDYGDHEITAFVVTGAARDKAGSYAIQNEGFHPVKRFTGCYCNVVGLPLGAVRRLLTAALPEGPAVPRPNRCHDCPDWD